MRKMIGTIVSGLMLLSAGAAPAFAKAHDQPDGTPAENLGQRVSSAFEDHAENGDARGITDGVQGIADPKANGEKGDTENAAGGNSGTAGGNSNK